MHDDYYKLHSRTYTIKKLEKKKLKKKKMH